MAQSDTSASAGNRIVVAVSGGGRTLENFLDRQRKGSAYQVVGVIASRPDCRGIEIARRHNLPVLARSFAPKCQSEAAAEVYPWIENLRASWIVLGGFLKPFPCRPDWERRIVNIHPALLPKYGGRGMYGHHVHEAVIASGDRWSGASVHFVNEKYDEGDIIAQVRVPVFPQDTPDELAVRVFSGECYLFPLVMDGLVRGELPLANGEVLRLTHGCC